MASKKRCMVCCVTFDTVRILEPAIRLDVGRIHILHQDRGPLAELYSMFLTDIEDSLGTDIEIVEHPCHVDDLPEMFRIIREVLEDEDQGKVFVDISSGSNEFAAAAMMCSLMYPHAQPFTLRDKSYTSDIGRLKDLLTEDSHSVKLLSSVSDPIYVPVFALDPPSEELVKCLEIIDRRNRLNLPGTSSYVIGELKEEGIWEYESDERRKATTDKQKELMYYKRHYAERLIEEGWVEDNGVNRRYVLTSKGDTVLRIFRRR